MSVLTRTASDQIAGQIRDKIKSGELAAGDRVPSTREIMRRWGVAMATASKVLSILKEEGLVRTRQGAGTVVARTRSSRARVRARAQDTEAMLTTELIVAAATAIADKEGLSALSMRRVAVDLDVATMSLYRHLGDKDDLLVLMIDAAFAEWQAPPTGNDWRKGACRVGARAVAHLPSTRLARACVLVDAAAGRTQRSGVHRAGAWHAT